MARNNISEEKKKTASPARIIICLTVICLFVAGLLGVVNHYTKPQSIANENAEKQEAIKSIFGEGIESKKVSEEDAENELYVILKDGKVFGYCAEVAPNGFGGEIKMMVGVDYEGKVCGANIVTMSETPGLGSRTKEEAWFLEQFAGKSGELAVGNGVDAITGATISSKAVTKGVSDALALGVDLTAEANKLGTTVWGASGAQTEAVTEAASKTEGETEAQSTEAESGDADLRLEDTVVYVEAIDGDYFARGAELTPVVVEVFTETDAFVTETVPVQTDWAGNPIFPPETEEQTQARTEKVTEAHTTKAPEKVTEKATQPQTSAAPATEAPTDAPATERITEAADVEITEVEPEGEEDGE